MNESLAQYVMLLTVPPLLLQKGFKARILEEKGGKEIRRTKV